MGATRKEATHGAAPAGVNNNAAGTGGQPGADEEVNSAGPHMAAFASRTKPRWPTGTPVRSGRSRRGSRDRLRLEYWQREGSGRLFPREFSLEFSLGFSRLKPLSPGPLAQLAELRTFNP